MRTFDQQIMFASANPVTNAWDRANFEQRAEFYAERQLQIIVVRHQSEPLLEIEGKPSKVGQRTEAGQLAQAAMKAAMNF